MRAPFNWIKEFVEFDWNADQLAEKLTFSGMEVESIETFGFDYSGFVAAEIKAVNPHPNADKLTLCDVDAGDKALTVVCGARNFQVGDKVALACVGAVLPDGMKIKPAKIRGQASEGMLCAEDELGISEDHSGILILPPETMPGTPLSDILGGPEPVLVIEVTPNRPDCLSIMGLARETAALCGSKLKLPRLSAESEHSGSGSAGESFSVRVNDPEGCPRYTARSVSEVAIGPSPSIIRRRLMQCGVRPINNVVDITNYVMMETGQPLHAFDRRLISDSSIIVRRAAPGETITALDGVERKLDENILVIADSRKPVAIAGIMGGEHSGVLDDTREILLESAAFAPGLIRSGSKSLGLSTESSYRFERGVDPDMAGWAGERAAALIVRHCGGVLSGQVADVYHPQPEMKKIRLRLGYTQSLLGIDISMNRVADIFRSLELEVSDETPDSCVVRPPTFRADLENEADLCEEVARIHGLDKIPMPSPHAVIVPDADDSGFRAEMKCRSFMADSGLNEIMNYSFVSERLLDMFSADQSGRRIVLPNPISADHTVMRNSLIPQMMETLGRNRARQTQKAGLFEMGRVFFKNHDGKLGEENRLAVGLMGSIGWSGLTGLREPGADQMFLWVKGVFERLCAFLKIRQCRPGVDNTEGYKFMPADSCPGVELWPTAAFEQDQGFAIMTDGRCRGVAGVINRNLRAEWRLTDPVAVLEISLDPFLKRPVETAQAKELPAYPSVQRDMALIVPENIRHEDVLAAVEKFAQKELTNVELFDIYKSMEIGSGRKSLAYSFTYRSLSRTLTDEEVNELHDRVRAGIKKLLPVEIR